MIDVFFKVLRWQMVPIEAKFQSYVAFVAKSRNVVFIKRFGSDSPYKGKLF